LEVTTMTTTKKSYPFLTKAQIALMAADFTFCCEAMVILFDRQTRHEQDTSSTLNKNRRGFMSSHAVHGTRIAKALKAGEPISEEDVPRVLAIAPRYTKQLADHFRQLALEADPALAAKAACFFSGQ
jgi:hypothetical protein